MSKKLDKYIEDCSSKNILDIYHFFTKEQIAMIEKLGQKLENKKYTITEFDNLEDDIIEYLKSPEKLEKRGVSLEEYHNLIDTFKEVCKKYKL